MSEYKYDLGMHVTGKAHGKIVGRATTTAGDRYYTYESSDLELHVAKENEVTPVLDLEPFRYKVGDKVMYCGPEDYLKGSSGRISSLYVANRSNMAVYNYGLNENLVAYVPEIHLAGWSPAPSNGVNKKLEDLTAEVKELREKIASLLPKNSPKAMTEKVKVEEIKLGDIVYSFGLSSKVVAIEHKYSDRLNTRVVKVEVEDTILRVYNPYSEGKYSLSKHLWFTYGNRMSKVVNT